MHGNRRVTERTSLTRPMDAPDYVEFASRLRTRRSRIKQFQCCICAAFIAVFTMALVVTISYSVTHDIIDNTPNLTITSESPSNTTNGPLKLGFAPGSGSYTLFTDPGSRPDDDSILTQKKQSPGLTDEEFKDGLEAGRQAIDRRMAADSAALVSPLYSPSPESRHRYAVSTCVSVATLALAATGEIAATRTIENSRSILGSPSAMGSFFDGGWVPRGVCKDLQVPNCTIGKYRTYDGSCNRPMQWGASMVPFRRVLPPSYADGIDLPRRALSGKELPSAREISLKVHKPSPSSNPSFTVMLAVYGQFLDHDITATAISQGVNGTSISCCPPSVGHPECFPVRVATGDPVFDVAGRTCMDFVRSAPAPQCMLGPRQQLNQVTAFIDGSTIYGSDSETSRSLREFSGGRLRMQTTPDNRTLLPASTNPNDGCNRDTERSRGRYCFSAGDARANENLHLTTMHLLWARQHNRIAEKLAAINPTWDDEVLFEESRRIVGAQLQHITYEEFVPIVLGDEETSQRDLRPLKQGYRSWIDSPDDMNNNPTIANNFAAAAFRFAHTLLPGLMKMTNEQMGTSSYVELHRMLFNPYSLYSEGGVKSSVTSATRNMIQMTSTHVTSQLTNHLFEDPIGNTTIPCGLDLVSLNIQRGRDHGLPGYTRWREYCGLGKIESFADLEGHVDPLVLKEISILYESVHDVDLYTGALAELPKTGAIVGPTFTCLVADQFVRLQRGDRFWYEVADQPHSFTEDQLQELRKTSLARLICDTSDGITQTQAQVMRSIGPSNPMMSCEDIPGPSFEAWRDINHVKTSMYPASFMPYNWTEFKKNINDTIHDMVTFINNTRTSVSPETADWMSFKNYVNDSFSELRNQIAGLHPPKPMESTSVTGNSAGDSFILRGVATPGSMYVDWTNFKADLVKSLNNSISAIKASPESVAKWTAFKQSVANQFADLKNQIASMKSNVSQNLLSKKYKSDVVNKSNSGESPPNVESITIPAIFDWKNFKDNVIKSIDDTIVSLGDNMPPPGDPAWATFDSDIRDRFSKLRDEIDNQRSMEPKELTSGDSDWLAYKDDIIRTVNSAVKQIQDEMPAPGDPAWATYRDKIMKSFSAFNGKPDVVNSSGRMTLEDVTSGLATREKFSSKEMTNLTNDWLDFRLKINDTLTRITKKIENDKPTMIDPMAWTLFMNSAKNDFALLKRDIADARAKWTTEIEKLKSNDGSPMFKDTFKKDYGNYSKFDYISFVKPVIPVTEWVDFKNQINDTLMSFFNTKNDAKKIDFEDVHAMFDKSFADLRNDITSLKDLIANGDVTTDSGALDRNTAEWIKFQMQLNSIVNEFAETLKNQSRSTMASTMKALFETKDKLSNLESPFASGTLPDDWSLYVSRVNKSVADTLKRVGYLKPVGLTIRAGDPTSSSCDKPGSPLTWVFLFPCIALLKTFSSMSEFKVCSGC